VRQPRVPVAACLIGVLVAAAAQVASSPPSGMALLSSQAPAGPITWQDTLIATSRDTGLVDPLVSMEFLLTLRDDHQAEETADLEQLYDPHSAGFGRYRSNEEFARLFGPAAADVDWLRRQLDAVRLTADWRPGNTWLSVGGTAGDIAQALGIRLHRYQTPSGSDFVAPDGHVEVPGPWQGVVTGVDGLNTYPTARTAAVRSGGMSPDDILRAYDMLPLRDLGIDGTGQTVVVTVPGDGYRQEALDAYTTRYGLSPITVISKADDPLAIKSGGELEMDLEIIHAIAPGARLVVYASEDNSVTAMLAIQDRAVTENPNSVISQSWGSCERASSATTLDTLLAIYKRGAEHGVTAFASSGDSGAFSCLKRGGLPTADAVGAHLPASVPYVTGVGGTRLSVRSDGSYYHETVWSWPALTEASGGGPSSYYPRPAWQSGPGLQADPAGALRLTPDIAADAEAGMAIRYDPEETGTTLGWATGGGTSQSAPIWAGMTALINGYLARQGLPAAGFLNEALYALAREPQAYPPFHDIVQGNNLVESATPGYDTSTGLGSPDAWNLARDLETYMRSTSHSP
jgi:subtilase family serine protease